MQAKINFIKSNSNRHCITKQISTFGGNKYMYTLVDPLNVIGHYLSQKP